jgi:3-deoxy-7-phosphoheptulonate synthase
VIAVLDREAPASVRAAVVQAIEAAGCAAVVSEADGECRVAAFGEGAAALAPLVSTLPGVREVRPAVPLAAREQHPEGTRVRFGDVEIGGPVVPIIAGPCSVEDREQILAVARAVRGAGASALRGGAYKPRTSPYAFQGLGEAGLELLAEARAATGLPVVTEVLAPEDVARVAATADMLQIGARNMQNFALLRAAGEQAKPVLLKRGLAATLDELLDAAEYILAAGNPNVVLCERGVRTFGQHARNTFDVAAIPALKLRTHLPVIADPSHAAGRRDLVPALARAALAAGADALLIEVHPAPERARSDGPQSLTPAAFAALMVELARVAAAVGKRLA